MPSLATLARYRLWIALAAILISLITWISEWAGYVYVCPYCRAQRTVIGLLGLMLLLPWLEHWLTRWIAATIAFFGFNVGAEQHFNNWKKIMAGKFEWGEKWFINPWLLSGIAMFLISGLFLYLWYYPKARDDQARLEMADESR